MISLVGAAAVGGALWLNQSAAGRLWRVDRAIDKGRLDQAETILTSLIRSDDPRAVTRLARLRLLQHRPDSAARLLESRPEFRHDPEKLALLGEVDLALGKTQEAWSVYRALLQQRPDDISVLTRYAELTYRHAGLAEALIPFKRLEKLQPNRVEWPRAIGQIYMEIDRYELANAAFHNALRIDPADVDLRFSAAEAEFLAGRLEESLADLDQAASARPDDARIATARAECLMALGRTDQALAQLESALASVPDHVRALRLRAEVHLQRLEFSPAVVLLERARTIEPDDWRVLYKLSQAYDRLGRGEEARAVQARMVDLQRDAVERF